MLSVRCGSTSNQSSLPLTGMKGMPYRASHHGTGNPNPCLGRGDGLAGFTARAGKNQRVFISFHRRSKMVTKSLCMHCTLVPNPLGTCTLCGPCVETCVCAGVRDIRTLTRRASLTSSASQPFCFFLLQWGSVRLGCILHPPAREVGNMFSDDNFASNWSDVINLYPRPRRAHTSMSARLKETPFYPA